MRKATVDRYRPAPIEYTVDQVIQIAPKPWLACRDVHNRRIAPTGWRVLMEDTGQVKLPIVQSIWAALMHKPFPLPVFTPRGEYVAFKDKLGIEWLATSLTRDEITYKPFFRVDDLYKHGSPCEYYNVESLFLTAAGLGPVTVTIL